ncbi:MULTISPECIES: cytochrome P450 [Streptomyces]|jgi:cytochrome P450|uniref:Cytochrome P450 n=1 Tax=Streptomyces spinosisporus TaxID=2927582 RepID=A0ABS9XUM7_9ACTN|nr:MULTISPECIES: cytochrome P450 [Streptomyces]MCI3245761.1 cytochrome P450 [Streptomyces spinosisporus]WUB33449.1 cytochrome P450 [Streptomyces sp. NBC_00588]
MPDIPSCPVTGASESLPEYPLPRAAECPLAPAPAAQELRAGKPITKVRIWNGSTPWLITRHADQRALLPDPRVSDDDLDPGFPYVNAHRAEIAPVTPRLITNTDAPEHTRLRRTVNGPFVVRRIETMRAPIQKIVDDLIDDMLAGPNPIDLLKAFAFPLPSLVIAELLGVPYEDHDFFQRNSGVVLDGAVAPEVARKASGELAAYLDRLLTKKMTDPGEDVLSEMAGRVKAGEMTHTEAVHMGVAMLIAGHETTTTMISLGTLAFLQHPDQLALLREAEDPKVIANAVDEVLRYLTIVQTGVRRVAKDDIEIGDVVIRKGDGMIFDLHAANWDPEVFPEAECLDITRPARIHQAFGYGPHQCLGQNLARLELQVAYGALYRRIPTLRLAADLADLEFDHTGTTYGVKSLPVAW